ncbi:hypothetical protein NEUTE1DRAFT_148459 [Neurospora tetrasperma FGSC 2508]|uniref:Ecp2 effector protein domain-containing protein n=1 Tax=Neurospora tetrasperma (strain FGSC 2508 / ATCC MYA-4615 / P0657) TaxID=510951 RepID=F8MVU3_NEUT8|nr:uncharacterized protein NEUTE1DRAFT_148459 [Neurospora tetrasperma FGSC 2508]EGO53991.1 hypothetical protein NEUTE1DRAFT_148459 [Neurospora tetrasperma FGSC 2508]EGZ68588.1 hypothetical protein NEUTE2DRAFT_118565 [Neurospora tetrasperma FGSC 2509]
MQLSSTLALLASYFGLSTALHLPDGVWEGTILANGTYSIKAAGAPDSDSFLVEPTTTTTTTTQKRSGPIAKRYVGCFGYQLDASGIDAAVVGLKNWAGSGHTLTSGDKNTFLAVSAEGMIVYYCIDAPRSSGNLDVDDVNYALAQMDATCRRYEASYFKWDGSVEIVGKGRAGDNVCV